jgi:hypothetical protein
MYFQWIATRTGCSTHMSGNRRPDDIWRVSLIKKNTSKDFFLPYMNSQESNTFRNLSFEPLVSSSGKFDHANKPPRQIPPILRLHIQTWMSVSQSVWMDRRNRPITTLDEVTSLSPYKKRCFPLLSLFFSHCGLLGRNRFRTHQAKSLKNFVPGTKSSAATRIKSRGL